MASIANKTARLQRVAFQRHGQRKDELNHQHPAGHERIVDRTRIGFSIRKPIMVSLYQVGELPRKFARRASAIVWAMLLVLYSL